MEYKRTDWKNGVTQLNQSNMNNIEDGIVAVVEEVNNKLTAVTDPNRAYTTDENGTQTTTVVDVNESSKSIVLRNDRGCIIAVPAQENNELVTKSQMDSKSIETVNMLQFPASEATTTAYYQSGDIYIQSNTHAGLKTGGDGLDWPTQLRLPITAGDGINIEANTTGDKVVISSTGGGGVEVVQKTGTSTTVVMSQKAVTDELGKKLDAVTGTTDYDEVYVKKADGTFMTVPLNVWANNNAIPRYSSTGMLKTREQPSENNDAASKKYVDNSIAAALGTVETALAKIDTGSGV